jgi:hypothetical protein
MGGGRAIVNGAAAFAGASESTPCLTAERLPG